MKSLDMKRAVPKSLVLLVLLASLAVSMTACGGTTVTEFDPTQVLANFAVFQISKQTSTEPATVQTFGGAIFYKGVITLNLSGSLVEIIDHNGTAYPMTVSYSATSAPYYTVELPNVEPFTALTYTFRVTLSDGQTLSSSVTTPANSLSITAPLVNAEVSRTGPVTVDWTGSGTNPVNIVIEQLATPDVFSVYAVLGLQVADNGIYSTNPASNLMLTSDTGTGTRFVSMTRRNNASAGGFAAGSLCRAALIAEVQINVTE
jgi:hypothetical protein